MAHTFCRSDEEFPARLKRLREAAKLSQDKLGARAGITGQAVYMAESGQRFFQRHTAAAVARVLDVTPEYLLYGFEPTYTAELPPLDVYLRETQNLRDDDIAALSHIMRRLGEPLQQVREPDEPARTDNLAAMPADEEAERQRRIAEGWVDEEPP